MTKKRLGRPGPVHVAAYGAALSTLALAPQAHASSITGLTFDPQSVSFGTRYHGSFVSFKTAGANSLVFSVFQVNDTHNGKDVWTRSILSSAVGSSYLLPISLSRNALASSLLSKGLHALDFSSSASGTETIAFLNRNGNLGWFQINLGGAGNPVVYLAGGYSTVAGDPIHVGASSSVPEPSAMGLAGLGLLALGATEIRRRRKAQAK